MQYSSREKERRIGEGLNTIRKLNCDKNDKTQTNDEIIVSLVYAPNAQQSEHKVACPAAASQACYHYSYAIQANRAWATLTCPPEAATKAHRFNGRATESWSSQHGGDGWQKNDYYSSLKTIDKNGCEKDEFPPAYLLSQNDPAFVNGGRNMHGQAVRFLPLKDNSAGGRLWKGICFRPLIEELTEAEMKKGIVDDNKKKVIVVEQDATKTHAIMTVNKRPEFVFDSWPKAPSPPAGCAKWGDSGLAANPCWHQARQAQDPGPYNYEALHVQGANGS